MAEISFYAFSDELIKLSTSLWRAAKRYGMVGNVPSRGRRFPTGQLMEDVRLTAPTSKLKDVFAKRVADLTPTEKAERLRLARNIRQAGKKKAEKLKALRFEEAPPLLDRARFGEGAEQGVRAQGKRKGFDYLGEREFGDFTEEVSSGGTIHPTRLEYLRGAAEAAKSAPTTIAQTRPVSKSGRVHSRPRPAVVNPYDTGFRKFVPSPSRATSRSMAGFNALHEGAEARGVLRIGETPRSWRVTADRGELGHHFGVRPIIDESGQQSFLTPEAQKYNRAIRDIAEGRVLSRAYPGFQYGLAPPKKVRRKMLRDWEAGRPLPNVPQRVVEKFEPELGVRIRETHTPVGFSDSEAGRVRAQLDSLAGKPSKKSPKGAIPGGRRKKRRR